MLRNLRLLSPNGRGILGTRLVGVPGKSIPLTGSQGASVLSYGLSLPADNDKLYKVVVTVQPTPSGLISFFLEEDGTIRALGANGTYTFTRQTYENNVLVGTSNTATFTIGGSTATPPPPAPTPAPPGTPAPPPPAPSPTPPPPPAPPPAPAPTPAPAPVSYPPNTPPANSAGYWLYVTTTPSVKIYKGFGTTNSSGQFVTAGILPTGTTGWLYSVVKVGSAYPVTVQYKVT